MKNSIVLATAVASILTSGIAAADLSANATIASNYIWRGVSQTFDSAAGQGGIDWSNDSGLYVGTWVSNVDFDPLGRDGYEMDVYAGFAGDHFDVGVITYQYPIAPNSNFTEVYASGTMSVVTVGLAYTVDAASGNDGGPFDAGDMYLNGSVDFAAGKSDVSLYAGAYMFENDGTATVNGGELDYIHYGASIGKDGFSFAVDKNDIDSDPLDRTLDNVVFTASYTVEFEL